MLSPIHAVWPCYFVILSIIAKPTIWSFDCLILSRCIMRPNSCKVSVHITSWSTFHFGCTLCKVPSLSSQTILFARIFFSFYLLNASKFYCAIMMSRNWTSNRFSTVLKRFSSKLRYTGYIYVVGQNRTIFKVCKLTGLSASFAVSLAAAAFVFFRLTSRW